MIYLVEEGKGKPYFNGLTIRSFKYDRFLVIYLLNFVMRKYFKWILVLILILIITLVAYYVHWRYFELVHLKCKQTEIIASDKQTSDFLNKKSKKSILYISFDDAFYRSYEDEKYEKILDERFISKENENFRLYKNRTFKFKNYPHHTNEIRILSSGQMVHVWKKPDDPVDLIVKYNCVMIKK